MQQGKCLHKGAEWSGEESGCGVVEDHVSTFDMNSRHLSQSLNTVFAIAPRAHFTYLVTHNLKTATTTVRTSQPNRSLSPIGEMFYNSPNHATNIRTVIVTSILQRGSPQQHHALQ